MDISSRVVKKRIEIDGAWFEVKLVPLENRIVDGKPRDGFDIFDEIVLNWGELNFKGKEFPCTPANKKKFFKMTEHTGDIVQNILDQTSHRIYFSKNVVEYLSRLGELQGISKDTNKPSQNHTSQAVNAV